MKALRCGPACGIALGLRPCRCLHGGAGQMRSRCTSTSGRFCSRRPSARRRAARAASLSAASSRRNAAGRSATALANSRLTRSSSGSSMSNRPGTYSGRATQPAVRIHRQAREHDTVEQHPPARRHDATGEGVRRLPSSTSRPTGALSTTPTCPGARLRISPSSSKIVLAPASCECGVGGQVPPFAMRRHHVAWPHQPIIRRNSSRAGWPTRVPDGPRQSSNSRRGARDCPAPCRSHAHCRGSCARRT